MGDVDPLQSRNDYTYRIQTGNAAEIIKMFLCGFGLVAARDLITQGPGWPGPQTKFGGPATHS